MRVLFVCHHYPPEVGAPQRRWNTFIREWCRVGTDVTVLTALPNYPQGRMPEKLRARDWLGAREGEHGETVIRVPFLRVGRRGGVFKLASQALVALESVLVGGRKPDVVVSSVPGPATMFAGDLLAARYRVPHVVEFRDAWPDLLIEGSPDSISVPRAFSRWMTRRQRRADAVVSVTATFADVLVQRGVHPSRVWHVSNGIEVDAVPVLAPPEPHGGPLRVLYLGTHGVSQGLDNAVEAIARTGETVEARFVGDGTEKPRLQELSRELDARISFEDPIYGDELWDVYAWADTCLVHLAPWPSFDFTVPSKLYEIMALGRHVTGVLSGEASAIVREAGAGAVVPPGDPEALARTLDELSRERERLKLGGHPRTWVGQNADQTTLASRFLEVAADMVEA